MSYTTSDAETVFKVSSQTIRNWSREFARYLSVTAVPEEGRTRVFTDEDMRVLDLVSSMKNEGKQYDEIHAALLSGERGNSPGFTSEEVRALITGEIERRLQLEIQVLKRQLEHSEKKLEEAEKFRDESVRLKASLEASNGRVEELNQQLKVAQDDLRRLEREAGEAYYRGRLDESRNKDKDVE